MNLVSALIVGQGAQIFKYRTDLGSQARITSHLVSSVGTCFLFEYIIINFFDMTIPWWFYIIPIFYLILSGSAPATNVYGREFSFLAAIGLIIFFLLKLFII